MRRILLCGLLLAVSGCSWLVQRDFAGNENVPRFVSSEAKNAVRRALSTRAALITYCFDNHGVATADGLNCAILGGVFKCEEVVVAGQPANWRWLGAVCDGWNPLDRRL